MTQKNVAAAMSLAGAFMIGLDFSGSRDTIIVPLFYEASVFRDLWGLLGLKIALIGSYLYWGAKPRVLLLGALSTVVAWLSLYSATGAFVPQVVLNCLFMAVIRAPGLKETTTKMLAALFTSSIFLLAGLQKINALYLSGLEFQSPAGFIAYYLHFFGPLPTWLATEVLPPLSIVLELSIGIGLLYRPKIFAHLATLFILSLMYIHPPLALPYFTFAAAAVLIDPEFAANLQRRLGKIPLQSAFTWLVVLLVFQSLRGIGGKSAVAFLWFPAAFATVFIGLQVSHILQMLRTDGSFKETLPYKAQWRSLLQGPARFGTALIAFMLLTPALHSIGAPSPLGFSMFSANTATLNPQRARQMPRLEIQDETTCRALQGKLIRLIVIDVTLSITETGCAIAAPTVSGLQYTKEQLCENLPASCSDMTIR